MPGLWSAGGHEWQARRTASYASRKRLNKRCFSATGNRNDEFERGVCSRKADHFHVHQTSLLSGAQHIFFRDVFLSFGVDDPQPACFLEGFRQRTNLRKTLLGLGADEYPGRFAPRYLLSFFTRRSSYLYEVACLGTRDLR